MKIIKKIDHSDGLIEEHYLNGSRRWLRHNKYHREDGPAIEQADGTKYWYINGNLHREKGPAIDSVDGYKKWYTNGKLHRIDGPAIEWNNGSKHWYQNGLLHREDGPAIEEKFYQSYRKEWRYHGKEYSEQEFNIMMMKNELNKELTNNNEVKPKKMKL